MSNDSFEYYQPSQHSLERAPLAKILASKMWGCVNSTIYRYSPSLLRSFRRILLRLFGCALTSTSSFSKKAVIACPWNLKIGMQSSIGDNAWVYSLDKITIGDKTCIGSSVQLLTGSHDITSASFCFCKNPISIGSCVWIATSAIVLPGITIGDGSVVAAGAVVTKDVEPWTVVAGNPAKVIKRRMVSQKHE